MNVRTIPAYAWALLFIYFLSIALFFSDRLRNPIQSALYPVQRQILSIAEGPLHDSLRSAKVLKIKGPDGIWVEVYDKNSDGLLEFVDKVLLPDPHDAYLQFQGRALNLALQDIDGERGFEIIAPSYSFTLIPKLNVLKYNPISKTLEPYVN